ncbi:hypothetical protein U9M48_004368 [Paspalum notatum var. saurae]|uniref:FBD domain-containing protein n=1 Tax=Paspalum notatum var. saurae TaxID=547442 RepID=A0AAQ3PPX4_PASNO
MKHLSITRSYFAAHSSRSRIRLPSLASLVLTDFGTRVPLLEDTPLLVSATVRVTQRWYDECPNNTIGGCADPTCPAGYISDEDVDDAPGESVLFKGLSDVQNLEISVHSKVFIVIRDLKLGVTFHKLKTMLLSEWCPGIAADLNLLTYFLRYSPVLDKLTVQLSKVPKKQVETERSHAQLQRSFTCSHLKIVEIKCEEDDERLQELLDMLAAYDIPLEKVNIQQTDGASEP